MRIKLLIFLSTIFLYSCQEDGAVPSFIEIVDYELTTELGEGTDNDKITDAWIFVDGKSLGAYELPSTLPIISDGPVQLDIWPVIKENGVLANSIIYPFYTKMSGTYTFNPEETTKLDLQTTYRDDLTFEVVEDFEGGHFFTDDVDGDPATTITVTSVDAFEGGSSGRIVLNEDNPYLEAGWKDLFYPERAELAWVELNYKTNIPFVIGLRGVKDGMPVGDYNTFINTKNEWNKIYFNFSSLIDPTIFDAAQLVIVAGWTSILDVEEAEILIDNVKFIRLK